VRFEVNHPWLQGILFDYDTSSLPGRPGTLELAGKLEDAKLT